MTDPRKAVMARLSERRMYWLTQRVAYLQGAEMVNAAGAERMAAWCERAFKAERDDPKPAEVARG